MTEVWSSRDTLLSPAATRLLRLLTPERLVIDQEQRDTPAVYELQRAELIRVELCGDQITLRLSAAGRALRPSVNN